MGDDAYVKFIEPRRADRMGVNDEPRLKVHGIERKGLVWRRVTICQAVRCQTRFSMVAHVELACDERSPGRYTYQR